MLSIIIKQFVDLWIYKLLYVLFFERSPSKFIKHVKTNKGNASTQGYYTVITF